MAKALDYLLRKETTSHLSNDEKKIIQRKNLDSDLRRFCFGLGRKDILKPLREILPISQVSDNIQASQCTLSIQNQDNNIKVETYLNGSFVNSENRDIQENYEQKKFICTQAKRIAQYSIEEDGPCSEFSDIHFVFSNN